MTDIFRLVSDVVNLENRLAIAQRKSDANTDRGQARVAALAVRLDEAERACAGLPVDDVAATRVEVLARLIERPNNVKAQA